jgi:hypothetical protein
VPEVNQYVLSNRELLETLVKQVGVREGKWTLLANFGIVPGMYGPTANQLSPGVVVAIAQLGIQRAQPNTPEEMIVDAASVNQAAPEPSSAKRGRKKG